MFRVLIFAAVNLLVVITIGILSAVFGLHRYTMGHGIGLQGLLIMAALYGFVGSIVSLLMSKFMAKMMLGVHVIDPRNPGSQAGRDLVSAVKVLSEKAGMASLPEIGVYDSPEVNAFATGPSESSALVAVSSGLLDKLDDRAVRGVLGHEITHIKNGDMVTMALVQGVVNTFVIFFSRILAFAIDNAMRSRDRDGKGLGFFAQFMLINLLEVALMILAMPLICWVSRWREFRADRGSAQIGGKDAMIHALQSLKAASKIQDHRAPALATMKINGEGGGFLASLFRTHPPLDDRIEALRHLDR